jgi:hypothetical protein
MVPVSRVIIVCVAIMLAVVALAVPGCAAPLAPAPSPEPAASPSTIVLGPGLVVDRIAREIRVEAEVACDRGWLEQAACKAGTREHESLLAIAVTPSRIHAAILLLGIEPGQPGEWKPAADGSDAVVRVAPSGAPLALAVRTAAGEVPLSSWITEPVKGRAFPAQPWVFAGSRIRSNTKSMGPGEHYVADRTGSIVGLVTFGDEVIAYDEVLSDKVDVDAPEWQANTPVMPAPGTRVQLVIRPRAMGASR